MSSISVTVSGASIEELVAAIGACAAELAARPAPESAAACFEQAETLGRAADLMESAIAARVAEADRAGEPQRWGYPSATSWLRTSLGMRHARAADRVGLARQAHRLSQVTKRLACGELTYGHAAVIAAAVRRLDDVDCGKAEQILVGMVDGGCSVKDVAAAGDRIVDLIAERDGTARPPEDARREERQWWTVHRGSGGRALSKGAFSPELAALIRAKIEPLAKPTGAQDNRDHAQRMADALQMYLSEGSTRWDPILVIELTRPIWQPRRTPANPPHSGRPEPDDATCAVAGHTGIPPGDDTDGAIRPDHDQTRRGDEADRPAPSAIGDGPWAFEPPGPSWPVDGTGFTARLSDGTPISTESARRILLGAGFSTLVLGTDGLPLYLGRKVRCVTPHQRRAINARYRTCSVTGCDIPANLCEIDHANGWANGGSSDVDKLAPLCRFHNVFKFEHLDKLTITLGADGRYRYDINRPARGP